MRYSAGTSLADLERSVIEATDAYNDASEVWRVAEQARGEARAKLEKAQRSLDAAYLEFRSRAPGGEWRSDHGAPRIAGEAGYKAVARALAAE